MKYFGIAVTAALFGALLGASAVGQGLTKNERAGALKLTSELEASLDQSCQPVVDQIRSILDDFHTFQAARSTIANGYQAEIQATQTELARPFLQIEAEYEAFKRRKMRWSLFFGDRSGPFAHCLGYSGSTRDEIGTLVGIPALVTPISKVLGLNVQAPESVENIGERLVQLGILEPPPEPKVEIKRNGEEYLQLFAGLLEARNEGDSSMVKVEALTAVTHVLETAKAFTYGMFLGPLEPFTRDDLTVMQAFYQSGKDMTVGAVQGAVDSFAVVIENETQRGEELYIAIGGGNLTAAAGFADFGGAMQAVVATTRITLNSLNSNAAPKRSDHVSGIVGLVAYVDDLRFHNEDLKFLAEQTADSVAKFNRAVDTWMAVFQIALTFEGGKGTVKNAKDLGGKVKQDGVAAGSFVFLVERAKASYDQANIRFEQGKAIARKGKDSIVAAKNLLSRKKLGEDVPADAELVATKVLDEQRRIEEALDAETSISESTAFLNRQIEASLDFSGAKFLDDVTNARPTPD